MKTNTLLMLLAILTLTVSCERVKDATNMREHEAAKDAIEDLDSAGKHAVEAVQEEAAAAKRAAKKAVN